MRQPKLNKRTGLYGRYSGKGNGSRSSNSSSNLSLEDLMDKVYNPQRKKGLVRVGNKWVSKKTRAMAKDVRVNDADWQRQNPKKYTTRKERKSDSVDAVMHAKRMNKLGDSTELDVYAGYGDKKPKVKTPPVKGVTPPVNDVVDSSKKSMNGTTVGLSSLGTSVTYYKRGGSMKKGRGFDQHD